MRVLTPVVVGVVVGDPDLGGYLRLDEGHDPLVGASAFLSESH